MDASCEPPAPSSSRSVWSLVLIVLGAIAMLAGVLRLSSATVGGRVQRFEDRRTYDQVKRAAHEAWPGSLLISLTGLALVIAGVRLRAPRG